MQEIQELNSLVEAAAMADAVFFDSIGLYMLKRLIMVVRD